MRLNKDEFFAKYNISDEEFKQASLEWDSLLVIHEHYLSLGVSLELSASSVAELLRRHPFIHSVRTRIKDPEHLIDKIIRKTIRKKPDSANYQITLDNYQSEITDLIGVRVLHLFKDQAVEIDKYIRGYWELKEKCTIYYRQGDYGPSEEPIDTDLFSYQVHPFGYRSWHYLIGSRPTKIEHIAEIQVRTIFEEGWSEIDHQLRYPNNTDNKILANQLLVLNRMAGSADEFANSIRETSINLTNLVLENEKSNKLIEELTNNLQQTLLDKEISETDKQQLEEKVKELENSKSISTSILNDITRRDESLGIASLGAAGSSLNLEGKLYVKPGGIIPVTEAVEGFFSTRNYLEGYTHPALRKVDEDEE